MANRYYVTETLGPSRALTPEGFLVCKGTPLARTGELIYGPGETPIDVGDNGVALVSRDPSEVFHPDAMASAEGKPVVNEHPTSDVNPNSWRKLALGHVMNVRRGEGAQSDLLLADLFITDEDAIAAIEEGKRELSCGYSADYDEIGPGRGRQRNIRINHVALVEQGRCGPRCAIGDQRHKGFIMSKPKNGFQRFLDNVRGQLLTGNRDTALEMLEKGPDAADMKAHDSEAAAPSSLGHHTHIHLGSQGGSAKAQDDEEGKGSMETEVAALKQSVAGLTEAVTKIVGMLENKPAQAAEDEGMRKETDDKTKDEEKEMEANLKDEAPSGCEEQAVKARDSAYLEDSFKQVVTLAEILVPGIRIPVFDRASKPVDGYRTICELRRAALKQAASLPAVRAIVEQVNGGKTFDAVTTHCTKIKTIFTAAATLRRDLNNAALNKNSEVHVPASAVSGPLSIEDLQAINDSYWSAKS